MSTILNMLNSVDEDSLNLVVLVPIITAVVAAIALFLKFNLQKPEVAKKIQNVKKQHKLHSASISKQKQEKIYTEKKDKVPKEKKLLPSPNTSQGEQANNVFAKSNKQHSAVDEMVSKKNSGQQKKHQVNIKNNAPSNKSNPISNKKQKIVDIFINRQEEGEWQTVTTKKQKQTKQEDKIEIATKASKNSQKGHEKENKNPSKKTKKEKEETVKSDYLRKFDNSVAATPEVTEKECLKLQHNNGNDVYESGNIDSGSKTIQMSSLSNSQLNTLSVQETTSVANVAFDELGDDSWTDTKPQKKNRKRALRE